MLAPLAAGNRLHSFCDASLRAPNPTMMVVPGEALVRLLTPPVYRCHAAARKGPRRGAVGRPSGALLGVARSPPSVRLRRSHADTLEDARFVSSQFVRGEPHVRFYAGAPLVSPMQHRARAAKAMPQAVAPLSPSCAWRAARMRLGSAARGARVSLLCGVPRWGLLPNMCHAALPRPAPPHSLGRCQAMGT